jgi:uncharacterized membrane protein YeaQ/YmgE (transglycosylase-associated protein family)
MSIMKNFLRFVIVALLLCGVIAGCATLADAKDDGALDNTISGVVDSVTNVGNTVSGWLGNTDSSDNIDSSNGGTLDSPTTTNYYAVYVTYNTEYAKPVYSPSVSTARAGDEVSITAYYEEGSFHGCFYTISEIVVYSNSTGKSLCYAKYKGDNVYTFTMPAQDVVVKIFPYLDTSGHYDDTSYT